MPKTPCRIANLAVCLCLITAGVLRAQEDAPPEGTASAPPSAETNPPSEPVANVELTEVKPDTYYLRREDGVLVKVLNLPYEKFVRLYNQDTAIIEPEIPSYSLEQISIQGTSEGSLATLKVTFRVRLQSDDWTRIPLRFEKAILRAPPAFKGEGELFVRRDVDGEGYVCWLRPGQPSETDEEGEPTPSAEALNEFTAEFLVPLKDFGAETRLELQLPRAALSQMELKIPSANISATVSDGVLNLYHEDGETRLSVVGLAGDFRATWREGDVAAKDKRPVLQLKTATLVRIEGQRQVSSDVDLEVRSLRGEFEAFTIRLPAETRLFPRQFLDSGMQITELPAEDGADGKRVQVKLDRPTMGPVIVQLLAELTPRNEPGAENDASDAPPEYEVGGIEVEDAIRQSGTTDFAVQGNWSINWLPDANVHRTSVPDDLRSTVAARFAHSRRTFSLRIQVARRETQVSVEPQYVLYFEANRVRLEATLNYRLRGRDLYGVEIDMADWTINEVLPDGLVNREAFDFSKTSPLSIPLQAQSLPDNGEFSLRITAVRDIVDPEGSVSFTLPRPWAKAVSPAAIAVLSADNVEVAMENSEGLQRDNLPPAMELPVQQRPPQYFRENGDSEAARVVASVVTHNRSISVNVGNEIKLDEYRYRVEQRFTYRINYERLKSLVFDLDRSIVDSGTLKILHGDEALPPSFPEQGGDSAEPALPSSEQPEEEEPEEEEPERVQMRVNLLEEQIGDCELRIQYEGRMPVVTANQDVALIVPLIAPVPSDDTTLTGSTLLVNDDGTVKSAVNDAAWELPTQADALAIPPNAFVSDIPRESVNLQLSRSNLRGSSPTIVYQAWVQTWIGRGLRRERMAFRVQTDQEYLDFRLPEQAELIQVAVNSSVAAVSSVDPQSDPSTQRVSLPSDDGDGRFVVEFWYTLPLDAGIVNTLDFRTPELTENPKIQRLYWQVAMPPDEHLLLPPADMTEEAQWQPQGLLWQREARLSQRQLEQWVGASRQDTLPESSNQYLFSSFGSMPHSVCTTAGRSPIVICFSGLVLGLGLALIYLRRLRHPAGLFIAGVAVVTFALLRPELAIPSIQASALGLVLIGMALLLKRIADSRELQRFVIKGTPVAGPDSNTVRALLQYGDGSSNASTATALGPQESSSQESQS